MALSNVRAIEVQVPSRTPAILLMGVAVVAVAGYAIGSALEGQ